MPVEVLARLKIIQQSAKVLLLDDAFNDQQRTFIQHIHSAASHLLEMLAGLPDTEYVMMQILPVLGDSFSQPQTALFGYAKMLLDSPQSFQAGMLSSHQRDLLTTIYTTGVDLSKTTQSLTKAAFQARMQQRKAAAQPVDLKTLVTENLPIWRYFIREHVAIQIAAQIPSNLPPLYAASYHVNALLQHLAVTMASELIAYGEISLSAAAMNPATIEVQVFCTGIQLTQEEITILFQKDGRHIYVENLQQQGGTIRFSRDPGVGAAVILGFPTANL